MSATILKIFEQSEQLDHSPWWTMTKGAVPETWILENGEIDAKHAADQQERD